VPGSTFAFRFRGADQTFENGHPVEFLVKLCSVYNTVNCVTFDGVEGGFVGSCNFVGVTFGVVWQDGFGRPQLNVTNTHINTYDTAILANNCAEFTAIGNLIYGAIDAVKVTSGIVLRGTISGGCNGFLILGNTFENTSSSRGFNCVIIETGSYGLINANVYRTNGCGIDTAIWLTAGASSCRVGSDNIYGTQVTRRVLNQGASNVIAP
jgi:hypothetical protein